MSQSAYRAQLRAAVRGLWSGVIDASQFSEVFYSAIRRYLTQAWRAGAAKCGIAPADLTPEESVALENVIGTEFGYVADFTNDILARDKASGTKIASHLFRADQWAERWPEVLSQAEVMACKDAKMIWRLGASKVHCDDCLRLNGKVKRASTWAVAGLHPKAYKLQCGPGRHCRCSLTRTSLPLTPGPLPVITESAILEVT